MPPARQAALLELPLLGDGGSSGSVRLTQSGSRFFVAVFKGTTRLDRAPVLLRSSSSTIMERFNVPRDVADQLQAKLSAISGANEPAADDSTLPAGATEQDASAKDCGEDADTGAADCPAAVHHANIPPPPPQTHSSTTIGNDECEECEDASINASPQRCLCRSCTQRSFCPCCGVSELHCARSSSIKEAQAVAARQAFLGRAERMKRHREDVCTVCPRNICHFHATCRYVRQATLDRYEIE